MTTQPNQPKKQNYESAKVFSSTEVSLGFVTLRQGQYIHVDANGQAVEIRMDDDGNVVVCVSGGISVLSFKDVYGS